MRKFVKVALCMYLSLVWEQGRSASFDDVLIDQGDFANDIPMTVGIHLGLPRVTPGGKLGRWGVGNGGDQLRISFARARDYAANIVLRINPSSLSRISQPQVKQWIIDNQQFLAADILQTEHVWVPEAKPSCAWTVPPGVNGKIPTANPIEFSYPTCRESLRCDRSTHSGSANSFMELAQLLIHEAAHHFNADETFADQVAIAIVDAWQSGLMDSSPLGMAHAPIGSQKHAAVWTGAAMFVVGGFNDETNTSLKTATAYDVDRGVWTDLNSPDWFTARHDALTTWTGSEVFIWGGFHRVGSSTDWLFDGALYNPTTKIWTSVPKPSWWNPKASTWDLDPRQTLVWTGSKAIVWGGIDNQSGKALGAVFDPKTKKWEPLNTSAPSAPLRIAGHSAVWTGTKMIIWGGYKGSSDVTRSITNEGAVYDPSSNTWTPTAAGPANGSPGPRAGHQAVWIGDRMVVISGGGVSSSTDISATGGIYNPTLDTWLNFQSELMAERVGHKILWNGEEILLIGGRSNRLKTLFGEVYAFNPGTLRWRILPGSVMPPRRVYGSIVWTGSSALIWGGYAGDSKTQRSGGIYYP